MYEPPLEEIRNLRGNEGAVSMRWLPPPLYRDILADMETHISAYCKTARGPYSSLW
jgi:anthranilate synthase component 1